MMIKLYLLSYFLYYFGFLVFSLSTPDFALSFPTALSPFVPFLLSFSFSIFLSITSSGNGASTFFVLGHPEIEQFSIAASLIHEFHICALKRGINCTLVQIGTLSKPPSARYRQYEVDSKQSL